MIDKKLAEIIAVTDQCVETYIEERRKSVNFFISKNFSIKDTIAIQKKYVIVDLIYYPLNMLWSVPYFFIKKSSETFEKIGWLTPLRILNKVPHGFKTNYQKEIENLVTVDLLGWEKKSTKNLLFVEIFKNTQLVNFLEIHQISIHCLDAIIEDEVDLFSSSQALVSELSGTVITIFTGWLAFGDKSLGLLGIGDRIARKFARSKASSNFFLGEHVGSVFYHIFPPQPTAWQILGATFLVGCFLTMSSFLTCLLMDPLRKQFGLQQLKLNSLLDGLEKRLFFELKKEIKSAYSNEFKKEA